MNLRERVAEIIFPEIFMERRSLERQLEIDHLTGLGNRKAWDRAKDSAEADDSLCIVLFDLNNLGKINKAISHAAGDKLIKVAANCISAYSNRSFRLGGDEFIAVTSTPEYVIDSVRKLFGTYISNGKDGHIVVSISGTHGKTLEEADSKLQIKKREDKLRESNL